MKVVWFLMLLMNGFNPSLATSSISADIAKPDVCIGKLPVKPSKQKEKRKKRFKKKTNNVSQKAITGLILLSVGLLGFLITIAFLSVHPIMLFIAIILGIIAIVGLSLFFTNYKFEKKERKERDSKKGWTTYIIFSFSLFLFALVIVALGILISSFGLWLTATPFIQNILPIFIIVLIMSLVSSIFASRKAKTFYDKGAKAIGVLEILLGIAHIIPGFGAIGSAAVCSGWLASLCVIVMLGLGIAFFIGALFYLLMGIAFMNSSMPQND